MADAADAALEFALRQQQQQGSAAQGAAEGAEGEEQHCGEGGGEQAARRRLACVLGAVPAASPACWRRAVELTVSSALSLQPLGAALQRALSGAARGPPDGGLGGAAAAAVRAARVLGGAAAARTLYRPLLALPAPSCSFLLELADMERRDVEAGTASTTPTPTPRTTTPTGELTHTSSEATAASNAGGGCGNLRTDPAAQRRVRQLLEAAADAYGSADARVWLAMASFEAACGRGAGGVYWRATKALDDPEPFIQRYTALHGGGGGGPE